MRRVGYFTAAAAVAVLLLSGCTETADPIAPPSTPRASLSDLARVPWDGGPAFYKQFSKADAAEWDDPNFFPIGVWYGSVNPDQMTFDKARGINFYAQGNPGTDAAAVAAQGMFTLYKPENAPDNWAAQVGALMEDEVDGRFGPEEGLAHMRRLAEQYAPAKTGMFTYVNWTNGILTYDRSMQFSADYWNTSNVNSVAQYYYSWPCLGASRFRSLTGTDNVRTETCHTASMYAKSTELMREINKYRGVQSPIWALPEVVSIGGDAGDYRQITPAQVKAQVWAALIHEARGIMWFTQSPDQPQINECQTGDALATVRLTDAACARDQVQAMGEINAEVKALAPVLNTQSYVWNFGDGLDTMLKSYNGDAYIFAMTQDALTGQRTFTLPTGVTPKTVEVVNENRTIAVKDGKFTDDFSVESTHHVYKVRL
ncbi:hypothetical protein StoSoilA2_11520 [Arthrobacter sp. StoSoilA2]|uniref:hypothetical protein n=1 Tax=Arthrobacter sp. StoSoilA2 TaxID=2830990 RepID=UPI001CC617C9|nr:hypothetical protein [Arthrobacter sp. StoSoilA2]BCW35096.1 hypothetical protein StoSoilA2_11520 [Arthrobacter sp. StoSoilA2]